MMELLPLLSALITVIGVLAGAWLGYRLGSGAAKQEMTELVQELDTAKRETEVWKQAAERLTKANDRPVARLMRALHRINDANLGHSFPDGGAGGKGSSQCVHCRMTREHVHRYRVFCGIGLGVLGPDKLNGHTFSSSIAVAECQTCGVTRAIAEADGGQCPGQVGTSEGLRISELSCQICGHGMHRVMNCGHGDCDARGDHWHSHCGSIEGHIDGHDLCTMVGCMPNGRD